MEAAVKNESDRRENIDGEDLSEDDTFRYTQCDCRRMRNHNRIYYDHIRRSVIEEQKRYFILAASLRLQRLLRCMYLKCVRDFRYIHFLIV